MALATASPSGLPSARMVLLKAHDARGFVFFTNLESRKSEELKHNPHAALCFYWQPLGRQVRIEGSVTRAEEAEADAYFASRHPLSRLGAIASRQSRPLSSREHLLEEVKKLQARYGEQSPPRPSHWSGWRVSPLRMEFWQEGEFRLHDRELYERTDLQEAWRAEGLYP